jgi:hypothetical protein
VKVRFGKVKVRFEFIFLICCLQALMYPLLVACKSISTLRKAAAEEVVDRVRKHSGVLVDQVLDILVCNCDYKISSNVDMPRSINFLGLY